MRKFMMVLAAAVALTGAMSADAFARGSRGAPIGPMGQVFDGVNPADHPAIFGGGENAYGYVGVPHARARRHARGYERR